MISIPLTLTLGSIDSLLKKVQEAPDAALRFPAKIELRSMLSSAAYIQFLLTWAQLSNNREVQFTLAKHEHLPFLASAPETVLPLLLAKKISVRLTQSDTDELIDITDLKNKGLDIFAPIEGGGIQKSLFGNDEPEFNDIPSKGPKVHLLAADGEFRHAYPNWFYSGARDSRQIRDADDLSSLVRNVLNLIRNHSIKKYGNWVDGLSENLGSMLYELIDNTHKWGRQSTSGEPIKLLRGALFDVKFDHPGDKTRMSDIATEIPLIADFVTYHSRQWQTRNLGLLEMSVFDGGIGLHGQTQGKNHRRALCRRSGTGRCACLRPALDSLAARLPARRRPRCHGRGAGRGDSLFSPYARRVAARGLCPGFRRRNRKTGFPRQG